MDVLDAQTVADTFPPDGASGPVALLGPIFGSNGGYYNIETNPVYAQYAYGVYGAYYWSEPVPIPVGPAILQPGTVGVRFRNYIAGQAAVVSGALSERGEPAVQITSGGVASSSSSGAMQLVQDQLLTVAAASIDFLNIPQTFAHLRLLLVGRGDTGGTSANVYVRLNGDAGANYDWQLVFGNAAAAGAAEAEAAGQMQLGEVPAALAPADVFSQTILDLVNYSTTVAQKTVSSLSGGKRGVAAGSLLAFAGEGFWRNKSAVSRITLLPNAGNFIAGSRATLYGLAAA